MTDTTWFPYGTGSGDRLQLFCLPAAGGAASGFHPWMDAFADVDVVPVQLPGREARLDEDPITSAPKLIEEMVEPILEHAGEQFALFGHCMGALLAYDLAHLLTEAGKPPTHLIVSAHWPPHLAPVRNRRLRPNAMSDKELGEFLALQAGAPREILDEPDIMELLLPILRADLALCRSYWDVPRKPMPVPITAFGASDEPEITADVLAGWAERTRAGFQLRIMPGGHDYVYHDVAAVAEALTAALLGALEVV